MSRYLVSLVGQSNELGTGPSGSRGRVSGLGAPYRDSNDARSWWPACSEAMAQRGVWLSVANTAVGSTSLTEQWVGRARDWISGQVYGVGGYAITGGNVYKKTSAGVQTSTTTPAVGTGADGITWALARAVTGEDVDGASYTNGSALYDPNGYIATALAAVNGKPGYDEEGIVISIGQTDHTISSTRAQYAAAIQAVASHATGLGLRVWVGMTCYMAGAAARETTFQNVLLPGRTDALAALAGNSLVSAGANLRESLGVLTAGAADNVVGLQSDELHLTSAGYEQAGRDVAAAFAAGGW